MQKISIAYLGTPDFAADFLKMILDDQSLPIEVTLVITQPDQTLGRRKILTPTPVKLLAQQYGIEVWGSKLDKLLARKLENFDLALLFAYGAIIKKDLLEAPKYGFWNIHPSLLPQYRGTSPMTYPLIMGDKTSGVSLMKMDTSMDHGPIIAQQEVIIDRNERNSDLQQKNIRVAFELFKNKITSNPTKDINEILKQVQDDMVEQDHEKATYTRFQTKEDGYISLDVIRKAMKNEELSENEIPVIINEFSKKYSHILSNHSAEIIYNLFRGLYPWPGIWTKVSINGEEKRLKIIDMHLVDNKLVLKKVQLEGRNPTDFKQFNNQYSLI